MASNMGNTQQNAAVLPGFGGGMTENFARWLLKEVPIVVLCGALVFIVYMLIGVVQQMGVSLALMERDLDRALAGEQDYNLPHTATGRQP